MMSRKRGDEDSEAMGEKEQGGSVLAGVDAGGGQRKSARKISTETSDYGRAKIVVNTRRGEGTGKV